MTIPPLSGGYRAKRGGWQSQTRLRGAPDTRVLTPGIGPPGHNNQGADFAALDGSQSGGWRGRRWNGS